MTRFKCVALVSVFLMANSDAVLVPKKGQEVVQKASDKTVRAFENVLSTMQNSATVVYCVADKIPDLRLMKILKISGLIAAGLVPVAGGILCYRNDVYGIASVIGSWGTWWQSFKNSLGIGRLEDGQASMQKTLGVHTATLTDHTGRLLGLAAGQAAHTEQLREVVINLKHISDIQAEHGDRLNELACGQHRLEKGQKEILVKVEIQFGQLQDCLAQTATHAEVNQLGEAVSETHSETGQQLRVIQRQLDDVQGKLQCFFNVLLIECSDGQK